MFPLLIIRTNRREKTNIEVCVNVFSSIGKRWKTPVLSEMVTINKPESSNTNIPSKTAMTERNRGCFIIFGFNPPSHSVCATAKAKATCGR